MSQKLKELYEHPLFHGIKTEEEAYNLCKAYMEQPFKSFVNIFFLLETQEKLSLEIYFYEKEKSEVSKWCPLIVKEWYKDPHPSRSFGQHQNNFVERRNPQDLSQIARATIMDSINCPCRRKTDCCVRNLEEKIDLLRIPKSEKVNIKKLIHILNVVQ